MHLNKLELHGFKSFAKKTILEFPKGKNNSRGITVIVGPNGSGKTNVLDSVRWVLGEQSLKLLRGKKSEDVIFAGSSKKASTGMAEVSLFLENDDKTLPLDWQEITITRRAFRSGENEYLLNKNKVRLQDILLLLAQGQFGQRTYSVVGQGMIDAVLSNSPFERKDFFDDAAGVKPLNIKKEQAINKLNATKENLNQAEILLKEIEPRYRSLSRQVKRLERREATLQELQELQKKYFGHRFNALQKNIQTVFDQLNKINTENQAKKTETSNLKEQMAKLEEEIKSGKSVEACLEELFQLHETLLVTLRNNNNLIITEIIAKIAEITSKIEEWRAYFSLRQLPDQEQASMQRFFVLQKDFLKEEEALIKTANQKQEVELSLARLETQKESLETEIQTQMGIQKEGLSDFFQDTPEIKDQAETISLEQELARAKNKLEIIGGIDPETMKEYQETKERYEFLKNQSEDLEKATDSLQKVINELEIKVQNQFQEAFVQIKEKFSYYFQHIFSGGQASLELIKETKEPKTENEDIEIMEEKKEENKGNNVRLGVEIKASPPGKKVKSIASLSGGERALTSLALLYAILACRPSPFVVLDEVDASLDETNSKRCAEILSGLSETTQFILITHNRATMEIANTLYGVTMGEDGSSKLLSLKLEDISTDSN